jgi:hypothetical protein
MLHDGVDKAVADGLLELLSARGIVALGGGGCPVGDGQPAAADPLRPSAPARHLLSKYLRKSADVRFALLQDGAEERDVIRLFSASGPTSGASLAAPLSISGVHYTDRQWSAAVGWRLGTVHQGGLAPCHNECAKDEDICGEPLDQDGDHAVTCGCGPLRTRRHNDIADVYADIAEEIGGIVRREVFVPEFCTGQGRDAWLDVWIYGIPELPDALLDITVRHPAAASYRPAAAREPGHVASVAEKEKSARYPDASGRAVWPVAHETWGRLGARAEQLLEACAAAAARQAYRRGRLPGNCLRRWRAQLDAALHRGIAAQLMAARFGLPGRRRRRRAPADVAQLEARCPI